MNLIELKDIQKIYRLGEIDVPVLHGITLNIERGQLVALMGVSGSGKTTLMNILGCLDHASSGSYRLEGIEVTKLGGNALADLRNNKIGFVFQSFNLLPRTSALDNVMMPLEYKRGRQSKRENRAWAMELLERVGLKDRWHHYPSQLSGGQQQRVAIARSLVNRPSILFADEPTGNLDSKSSQEILQMFDRLNAQEGITVMLVTHDAEVAAHARQMIHIKDGIIMEGMFSNVQPVEAVR
jgi:putative ABC transport system ATP-binding protein